MHWKLELVVVPVSDVDLAKDFYVGKAGFRLDVDHRGGDEFRVVQLTPPGSACSISIGTGISSAAPGSMKGLHLVVSDIEAAREELIERGTDVSEIFHFGAGGQTPGLDPRADYGSFLSSATRMQLLACVGGQASNGEGVTVVGHAAASQVVRERSVHEASWRRAFVLFEARRAHSGDALLLVHALVVADLSE